MPGGACDLGLATPQKAESLHVDCVERNPLSEHCVCRAHPPIASAAGARRLLAPLILEDFAMQTSRSLVLGLSSLVVGHVAFFDHE